VNTENKNSVDDHRLRPEIKSWGKGKYPFPQGIALIECDEMKCVGCGICQMACSMQHFGIINKDLARIQIFKYLLPISKAIPVICSQCQDEERKCEKACPVTPPAIYYDIKLLHMVIDHGRCTGCMRCQKACTAKAIKNHPRLSPKPFVCDLCDIQNKGERNPQCVSVCPAGALSFKADLAGWGFPARDFLRKNADAKAELIAKRLYPMTRDKMWEPKKVTKDE